MVKLIILILIFLNLTTPSNAYLGPGIGAGILLATLGIVVAIIASIVGLIWFPLKKIFNKKKEKKKKVD
tara:strand:+ start:317 stop:523 length:207 start_codon:yes stop_codon:yes gene_type:complete